MSLHPLPVPVRHKHTPSEIQEGEVHLWTIHLSAVPLERKCVLDKSEQRRAERFHFVRDRQRFIASRIALRSIMADYLGQEPAAVCFGVEPQGKPTLQDIGSGIRFNLSHSDNLMLLALTSGRDVGVDVERVRDILQLEMLLEKYFDPAEAAAIGSMPPTERITAFLQLWTRTEACLKAAGVGILEGLRIPEPEHWSVKNFDPAPGYVAAVAVEKADDFTLSCRTWPR